MIDRIARSFANRIVPCLLILLIFSFFCGCAVVSKVNLKSSPPTSVMIIPTTARIRAGDKQQFTASVTGTADTTVTWLVAGTPGGSSTLGRISPTGLYTAPQSVPSNPSFAVTARSNADPTKSDGATVTIPPALSAVSVAVSPKNTALQAGSTQQFTAAVSGTTNTAVTWLVNDILGGNTTFGSISSAGLYAAPQSLPDPPVAAITAKSEYDSSSFADATVTITAALSQTSSSTSASYYVDASAGNDINDGRSPTTAWATVAKVNASSFLPGNQILFKRGDVWREMITVPQSGTNGNNIIFGAYGSGTPPQILGSISANIEGAWTNESGNIWYASASATPRVVWRNEVPLVLLASSASLVDSSQWWWDSGNNRLYIFSVGNPTTGGNTFEIAQRNYVLDTNGKNYLTFSGLRLSSANINNVYVNLGSGHVTFDGIEADRAYESGIAAATYTTDSVIIKNSTVDWNGGTGIMLRPGSQNWDIRYDSIHNNSQIDGPGQLVDTAGVYGWCNGDGSNRDNIIEYNDIYANGIHADGSRSTLNRKGIWPDTVTNWIIRYNRVHDNQSVGIDLERDVGNKVYGNTIYNNLDIGIWVWSGGTWAVSGNLVYNNTIYHNLTGIQVEGYSAAGSFTNNEVKNNISVSNTSGVQFIARGGAENDGTAGSGNIYGYNAFGPESTGFIQWGAGNNLSTYASFDAAYGSFTHSIAGDPLFRSSANADFVLLNNSPAIDVGANLGPAYENSLSPDSFFPWVLSNQNGAGSGWEIGAFVYLNGPRN
jgi:parallel beta-helix repeat protein